MARDHMFEGFARLRDVDDEQQEERTREQELERIIDHLQGRDLQRTLDRLDDPSEDYRSTDEFWEEYDRDLAAFAAATVEDVEPDEETRAALRGLITPDEFYEENREELDDFFARLSEDHDLSAEDMVNDLTTIILEWRGRYR